MDLGVHSSVPALGHTHPFSRLVLLGSNPPAARMSHLPWPLGPLTPLVLSHQWPLSTLPQPLTPGTMTGPSAQKWPRFQPSCHGVSCLPREPSPLPAPWPPLHRGSRVVPTVCGQAPPPACGQAPPPVIASGRGPLQVSFQKRERGLGECLVSCDGATAGAVLSLLTWPWSSQRVQCKQEGRGLSHDPGVAPPTPQSFQICGCHVLIELSLFQHHPEARCLPEESHFVKFALTAGK